VVDEDQRRRISEDTLREIVRRIVEAVHPEKIILFGSAARGEMGPDSDLDLLVVKSNVHRRATIQTIEEHLMGLVVPTDIIVATPEDLERHKDTIGLIYRPALRGGRVVYAA
jgi:predicted nucleotidyltransferase